MQLKDKETGVLYNIISGKILSAKQVKKINVTASFITVKNDAGEEIGVVFGYTKDGIPSQNNKFELVLEKGEKL